MNGNTTIRGNIRSAGSRYIVALAAAWCITVLRAADAATPPEPVVAIHVSELTQALETVPAAPTTPTGPGTTGYEWWPAEWHYFVAYDSLEEAFRSDGTPFVEVSDADIAAGRLRYPDGSPRYPIVVSLAAEAVAENELDPLRAYVAAGGFLFVGSSSFTRNPDGTTRGDFAIAGEMGLHTASPSLRNWSRNITFTKLADHRLTAHVPPGTVSWRMPLSADEVPLGTALTHAVHGSHYVFQVYASAGTTVLANGDPGPLLALRPYGKGTFIYHGAMQPLVGHTIYDPSMYAYLIYRRAVEWAFESAGLPIVRVSPLRFDYDGAFVVRHDCENNQNTIRSIEATAAYDKAAGGRSDFYLCTGTLRDEMPDRDAVVASLRRAVTNSEATIGSHNGGLKNPVASLPVSSFDYWHWGPDEALDITPPGYASGKAYAQASILSSFQDIEGWLSGTDNGRAGCGAADTCPRIWAAPYMNSTREASKEILEYENVASLGTGEEKIGPYPHRALSYETPGKRFSFVSEPTSDWYVGTEIPGALEWGHTTNSMRAAVDFYYDLGAPVNLYSHQPSSDSTLMGQYVNYCASKPRMWAANAVAIADWWKVRSAVTISPSYSVDGTTATMDAAVSGASDGGTALEFFLPAGETVSDLQVLLNGSPADGADYRSGDNSIKVRVGTAVSTAAIQYSIGVPGNPLPALTGLSPSSATAGGTAFTLTVDGGDFIAGSTVRWNGADRATTFVSSTTLSAAIPAADIAAAGTADVTVYNPAPGGGASNALVFTISADSAGTWTQTDWSGGGGQAVWSDASRYDTSTGIDTAVAGQVSLAASAQSLFNDDFTRPPDSPDPLSPWTASLGAWTVDGGVLSGTGPAMQYSYASLADPPQLTDYTVRGRIRIPAGSFGGGLGGRLDPATGAHYGVWIYPSGSPGGSNLLKLWKFRGWTDIGGGVPMQQVSIPEVGTDWHALSIAFEGSRIVVYCDGVLRIDMTDAGFDSRPPYLAGGITVDWWTWSLPYTITADDLVVTSPPVYSGSGSLVSSAFDGGEGVQWQSLSWDGQGGGSTAICLRTRTADIMDQLAGSPWSDCYATDGAAITSTNGRWMQYQLELSTADPFQSPAVSEVRLAYDTGPPMGAPVPSISALSPSAAGAGGDAFTLTVDGSDFGPGSVVRWNDADRPTTFVSGSQLTAQIAAADIADAGTALVTVFTPAPGGGTSNALAFTINAPNNPVPTATSLAPSSAAAGGSDFTLTVDGSDFSAGSVVRWNDADRPTTFVSGSQLTAQIAAADIADAGTADVTVFNPAPGGGTSNALAFEIAFRPEPVVESIDPSSTLSGGAAFSLTVDGTGFLADSTVLWNGSSRSTTFLSASRLTAAIDADDIGNGGMVPVAVFTAPPGGGTSNALTMTVANPEPETTRIRPGSRRAGSGDFTLTVYGNGFRPGSVVRWNGADRPTTYVQPSRLRASISASDIAVPGTASVTVSTPAPGGGVSNGQLFTVE